MQQARFLRTTALTLALGLAGLAAPTAQALNIVLTDEGATPMSATQFAALRSAADIWQSRLKDDVTVYLGVSFANLGPNILGDASSQNLAFGYDTVRERLKADRTSATDESAVASLPLSTSVHFRATQPDGSVRLDDDGSTNNSQLWLSTANARALGLDAPTSVASPDARIRFANAFAGSFAYTRSGGIGAGQTDFITVAEHEIGHALGFLSGVDDIAFCRSSPDRCGNLQTFDDNAWYSVLDLYRYRAPGERDLSVGANTYFSIDGGTSAIQPFSNGVAAQASHFGGYALTLMHPYIVSGVSYDTTDADLLAMDAIGWNLANPVPEPATQALLLGGLAVLGWFARRRVSA